MRNDIVTILRVKHLLTFSTRRKKNFDLSVGEEII
jgi:hypothetical protein